MKKEWVFEEIDVECYAGHKGEETPRAIIHQGKRYEILEVLDRWYQAGPDPRDLRHDYFKVKATGGEIFLIRYTPRFQAWTLCRKVPAPKFSNN
ncbi:MAG: hypothetical protein HY882_06580 [Deltaproteobacteria bacterium]|nr:hypothetical protein [Deltaproteobacteria bacterium]